MHEEKANVAYLKLHFSEKMFIPERIIFEKDILQYEIAKKILAKFKALLYANN